ncbi:hypothetical protein [Paraburkholderia fungorum]|uniref:hypothetical protein n=1 Tax=Paraburkholderia fungorum TaxID=134537 RepID=UPI0038BD6A4F
MKIMPRSEVGVTCDAAIDASVDPQILTRCKTLGLSLAQATRLAALTFAADPHALEHFLDVDVKTRQVIQHRKPKRWVSFCARTASVSYRGELPEQTLLDVLGGTPVPDEFRAHIGTLLDEAPLDLIVAAVAEAAQRLDVPINTIWNNVATIAERHCISRKALWRDRD